MELPSQQLLTAHDFLLHLAENQPRLPYEPTLLPLLFAKTSDPSKASIEEISRLIERSQKLATRILSVANSASYGLTSAVTSLHRAISILGINEVRSLVMMVGAVSALKSPKLPAEFDGYALWKHQLEVANMTKKLVRALRNGAVSASALSEFGLQLDAEEAYVVGLLHDIGKVFLAGAYPDTWRAIRKVQEEHGGTFDQAEVIYWGMDHGLIGAQVLHHWKLPAIITEAISWHHSPQFAPEFKAEAKVLAAANMLAHCECEQLKELPAEVCALLPPSTDTNMVFGAVACAFTKSTDSLLAEVL